MTSPGTAPGRDRGAGKESEPARDKQASGARLQALPDPGVCSTPISLLIASPI